MYQTVCLVQTSTIWLQVDFSLSDITVIWLQTGSGTILVINIYNDGDQQQAVRREVHEMRNLACTGTMAAPAQHQIWWGNFNLHHLL